MKDVLQDSKIEGKIRHINKVAIAMIAGRLNE